MILACAAILLVALTVVGLLAALRIARSASAGKQALLAAEADLRGQRLSAARNDLILADQDFRNVQHDMADVRPGVDLTRFVPLLDVQVHAVQVLAEVGVQLSQAGLQVVDALQATERLSGGRQLLSDSLGRLRSLQLTLATGSSEVDAAQSKLATLNGYRLFGPLGQARSELATRMATASSSIHSATDGLAALIVFVGGSGPRQYLVLSQNPDEIRPTGGYIGSYGLLSADRGALHLAYNGDIHDWELAHPDDVTPPDQTGSPFRLYAPPIPENLANVNTVPDWPEVAQLALGLWRDGGQQADGVVSFTPEFMARVLAVVGPVRVPSYNITVTSANVVSELDYYTHVVPNGQKTFLPPLGQAVLAKLLAAPSSQWANLAIQVGRSFSTGDLLVWSQNQAVESVLAKRGWTGALPPTEGDFFDAAQFDYEAKNGGGIRRTYNHQVTLEADGSAEITTTITFDNSEPAGPDNNTPLLYVTVYAPASAMLTGSSATPASVEATLAGHPAVGFYVGVSPQATTTLTVTWQAPSIAVRLTDGQWQYRLDWPSVIDNTGDVLDLTVNLPRGARWTSKPPPERSTLTKNFSGAWTYRL